LGPLFSAGRICRVVVAIVAALVIGVPRGDAESPAATGGPGIGEPVTIRIDIGDRSEIGDLTRLVSIEDVRGLEVRAVATTAQLVRLREAGYTWRVLPPAVKAADVTMCPPGWEDDTNRSWSCYPSYDQYTAIMHRFASDHPTLCRIVDLGAGNNTVRPHRLWAVVLTDNPEIDEAEPEVLLTSTMHGDETTGYVLMLRLIDHLLMGHGTDPEITALVDETELWINPLANPDGTYRGGDDTVANAIRSYTTPTGGISAVDPNRNFPDFEDGDHPDGFAWWPETEAMMALAESKTFVLSANFHGGVEVVNYPWDTVPRRHPDDLWFEDLARDWADLAQTDSPGGYMTDFDNGITNGYDWFPIHGGRQDFMTFFHGGREVTIEVSETKLLPADELEDLWLWNRRALLDFVAHAQNGIRGVVTDPDGTPLAATIEVVGVDRVEDGSMVRTDPAVGDFHRLLLSGLYDLRIKAHGFLPHVISGVAVSEDEATTVDVILNPQLIRRPSRRVAPQP
jgi:hypothetical protein